MSSKLYNAFQLIRKGHYAIVFEEFKRRMYSRSISIGLQRDLENEFLAPAAKVDIKIRPLKKKDLPDLLDTTGDPTVNPRIAASQQSLVNANIRSCYVAVTADDRPCYMQWLIGCRQNDRVQTYFKGIFPLIKSREALLEGAYSNPDFRGQRIMPRAMALIAEKAKEMNVRWVNTFVDASNIPSLKGCQRSGFQPYLIRKERWFFFRQTCSFHPVPGSMTDYFEKVTGSATSGTGKNQPQPKSANSLNHAEPS